MNVGIKISLIGKKDGNFKLSHAGRDIEPVSHRNIQQVASLGQRTERTNPSSPRRQNPTNTADPDRFSMRRNVFREVGVGVGVGVQLRIRPA